MLRPALLAVMLLAPAAAAGQSFPPTTDRDFALDLTVGTVLGSIRTIGMGGASVAMVEQASGMGANAAAPAVRTATSNDWWDWDASLDWLNPDLGDDFDNNGQDDGGNHAGVLTGGLALELGPAGIGIDLTNTSRVLEDFSLSVLVGRLLLAYVFPGQTFTVGAGVRAGQISLLRGTREIANAVSWSGTAGFLWRPRDLDVRLGASLSLPVVVPVPDCTSCSDVIPEEVRLPWEAAVGVAWRLGPTRWNQQIKEYFRDERALTVAADVVVIGPMDNAYGLQAYAAGQLQPSGRHAALSIRAGGELEAIPGWLRLRAGSYWEPGRLAGAGGRLHGTGGVELRILAFRLWSLHSRVRVSFTIDAARDYGNGGLSLGFW